MDSREWVNLLRTPEERLAASRLASGGRGGISRDAARALKVLENTPHGKAGVKKNKSSEVEALRVQVASLAKEKRDLTLRAAEGERLLNGAKQELQRSTSQTKVEMEDQRRVIHKLSADNARLIRQVESQWQQSPGLKTPPSSSLLANHTPQDHAHPNGILVKDLERLSQRATELSQALSSTQQARTALEREVLALKRSQLDLQTSRSQLEEALAKSEEERAALYQRLRETEDGGRRRSEQLQLQMETALNDKTAKLEELLSLSERLQTALSSLSREKTQLEGSLREQVASSRQLTTERNDLKTEVAELGASLEQVRGELARMQDHQLNEVTEMKTILENEMTALQRERDDLREQVEGEREERETAKREVEATRAELSRADREMERLSEEVARLQVTLDETEREKAVEMSEMTARLAELSARCEDLEREREEREGRARKQMDKLTNRLTESGVHGNQLEAEAQQLRQLLDSRSHDLQAKSRDLNSAHSEIHASKMAQAKLEQQVSDLEGKVLAFSEQISARTELTNEMRGLLEQRANQIQELETIVSQQREELLSASSHTHLSASHSHLFSGDSAHIPQATPIQSPYSSRPISPEPRPLTTPTSNEVSRLRKQLSESRSRVLRLEASCEEIRTESAKFQGSAQALMAIRDGLTEENKSLSDAKRRAGEGQRSAEEGRRRAEEGRKALSRQLSSVQSLATGLRSQVTELRGEKEEAMSQISELHEAFTEREAELAEELAAMEVQSMAASETGDVERDYLQLELAKSRARNTELEQQLVNSQKVIERERDEMLGAVEKCSTDLCTLRRDHAQVEEECRLAASVNAKQTNQVAEKEGRVSELLGEVEVLRARKVVMMRWLCDTDNEKGLRLELESVKEELRRCQDAHAAETLSLTQQLEAERGEEESGRSLVLLGEGRGQRGSNQRLERLRARLRTQVEQSNYLRVKLGYTLKELQLYKELKAQLDSQLSQQATELASLQDHYSNCLLQLQQVERLGFQATVSPSNSLGANTGHL